MCVCVRERVCVCVCVRVCVNVYACFCVCLYVFIPMSTVFVYVCLCARVGICACVFWVNVHTRVSVEFCVHITFILGVHDTGRSTTRYAYLHTHTHIHVCFRVYLIHIRVNMYHVREVGLEGLLMEASSTILYAGTAHFDSGGDADGITLVTVEMAHT